MRGPGDRAGRDEVDAHAERPELDGERPDEPDERQLARGVRACGRTSGACPSSSRSRRRFPTRAASSRAASARHSRNVPVRLTRSVSSHSSGVTFHSSAVGPAMPLLATMTSSAPTSASTRCASASTSAGRARSVGHDDRRAAGGLDLRGRLLEPLARAGGQHDPRALAREARGDHPAEALAGAGDERRLSLEPVIAPLRTGRLAASTRSSTTRSAGMPGPRRVALVVERAAADALADDRDLPQAERVPERQRGQVAAGLRGVQPPRAPPGAGSREAPRAGNSQSAASPTCGQ